MLKTAEGSAYAQQKSLLKLDSYDVVARLCPVLLMILPLLLASYLVLVELGLRPWLGILGGLASACGLSFIAVQWAGDMGREWERGWTRREGPLPSIAMLRHRDSRLSRPLKARYHQTLQSSVPNLRLPTADEEATNPGAADEQYDAACAWLRARARQEKDSGILARHLRSYGFRRNLMGLRAIMLMLNAGLILLAAVLVAASRKVLPEGQWQIVTNVATIVAGVALVHAFAAALILRVSWVRQGAEAYAKSLLERCDMLDVPAPRRARTKTTK